MGRAGSKIARTEIVDEFLLMGIMTDEEYKINLPQKTMPDPEKSKDTTVKE